MAGIVDVTSIRFHPLRCVEELSGGCASPERILQIHNSHPRSKQNLPLRFVFVLTMDVFGHAQFCLIMELVAGVETTILRSPRLWLRSLVIHLQ